MFYPNKLYKFLIANIILSLLIVVFLFENQFHDWKTFSISFVWAFAITITQWIGHQYINEKLNRRFSWISRPLKRTIYGVIFIVGYAVIAFLLVQLVMYSLINGKIPDQFWRWLIHSSVYPMIISFTVSFVFTSIGFLSHWKESVINAERLKTEMMNYKYEALRNQINPHFLFNSFNVLSDLVYDDPAIAVKFIAQMSTLFRYVLDSRDKELVTLIEEMDFIKAYIYLLRMRFEDKLIIGIDVDAAPDDFIVPMSIQLLIENAVKHNEVSKAHPLSIKIVKQNGRIKVTNELRIKHVGKDAKEIGLKNIRQQFGFFTEKEIEIENTETDFSVSLPVLKSFES